MHAVTYQFQMTLFNLATNKASKSEIRSTKSETNSNYEIQMFKTVNLARGAGTLLRSGEADVTRAQLTERNRAKGTGGVGGIPPNAPPTTVAICQHNGNVFHSSLGGIPHKPPGSVRRAAGTR